VLKARTRELYAGLLRNHLLPTFGAVSRDRINETAIRRWRKTGLMLARSLSVRSGR
jgi:hypothetical protein